MKEETTNLFQLFLHFMWRSVIWKKFWAASKIWNKLPGPSFLNSATFRRKPQEALSFSWSLPRSYHTNHLSCTCQQYHAIHITGSSPGPTIVRFVYSQWSYIFEYIQVQQYLLPTLTLLNTLTNNPTLASFQSTVLEMLQTQAHIKS